jgi:hypothetical protein
MPHEKESKVDITQPTSCPPFVQEIDLQCLVYLSDPTDEEIRLTEEAIAILAAELGFTIVNAEEPELSSWFRRFTLRSKQVISSDEAQDQLKKVKRTLELKYLEREQGEVDNTRVESAVKLLEAIRDNDAIVLLDSLLLVKLKGKKGSPLIILRSLNYSETQFLRTNQHLLKKPRKLLKALERQVPAL